MVKNIRPEELMIAKLIHQNEEREKRALELMIANKELASQNKEIQKCVAELTIANIELSFRNEEKEKRAEDITIACAQLRDAEVFRKEQIQALEKMMLMTSQQMRQPVANIVGLTCLLHATIDSSREQKKVVGYLRKSARSLDTYTKQLTKLMYNTKVESGNNNCT